MTTYDVVALTIEYVKKNWDIDDDIVERWLVDGDTNRNEWLHWIPNGIYLSWGSFSEREKCLMISVAHRQQFKIKELLTDIAAMREAFGLT